MEFSRCIKESFAVIGKEGFTGDGAGVIRQLWEDANCNFGEVAHLAKKDEKGNLAGVWGVMSDINRSFLPWEEGFTKGLYLAGVECEEGAEAPEGWTRWVVPGFEYVYTEKEKEDTFSGVLEYLAENGLELAGAVQEFNCPETRKEYLFFPIRRL